MFGDEYIHVVSSAKHRSGRDLNLYSDLIIRFMTLHIGIGKRVAGRQIRILKFSRIPKCKTFLFV